MENGLSRRHDNFICFTICFIVQFIHILRSLCHLSFVNNAFSRDEQRTSIKMILQQKGFAISSFYNFHA